MDGKKGVLMGESARTCRHAERERKCQRGRKREREGDVKLIGKKGDEKRWREERKKKEKRGIESLKRKERGKKARDRDREEEKGE